VVLLVASTFLVLLFVGVIVAVIAAGSGAGTIFKIIVVTVGVVDAVFVMFGVSAMVAGAAVMDCCILSS